MSVNTGTRQIGRIDVCRNRKKQSEGDELMQPLQGEAAGAESHKKLRTQ